MRVLRWVLIVWSVLGGAGTLALAVLFAVDPFPNRVRVAALVVWCGLYAANLVFLVNTGLRRTL